MKPTSFEYRVFARRHPIAQVKPSRAAADMFGAGCNSAIAFVVGALIVMAILPAKNLDLFTVWGHQDGGVVLVCSLVTATFAFAISAHLSRRQSVRSAEATMRAQQAALELESAKAATAEADATTQKLRELLTSACTAAAAIPGDLEAACGFIPLARHELRERAYTPFWVAVEHSAELLVAMTDRLREITAAARDYERLLLDRDHDFPPFPILFAMLPDPSPTANALSVIIRLGQTDHEFASIQVQLEAVRGPISGFRTLADMLDRAPASAIHAYTEASVALRASAEMIHPRLVPTMAAAQRVANIQQQILVK